MNQSIVIVLDWILGLIFLIVNSNLTRLTAGCCFWSKAGCSRISSLEISLLASLAPKINCYPIRAINLGNSNHSTRLFALSHQHTRGLGYGPVPASDPKKNPALIEAWPLAWAIFDTPIVSVLDHTSPYQNEVIVLWECLTATSDTATIIRFRQLVNYQ